MTEMHEKKKKHGVWLTGALFSVALAGVCIFLFLLSDAGASLLSELRASRSPALSTTPGLDASETIYENETTQQPLLSAAAFLKRAERLGADAKASHINGNERAATYAILGGTGKEATLVLSLQNGEVTALTISIQRPEFPAPLASDASWILREEHAARQEAAEGCIDWFCTAFCAYALALDSDETFSYAEAELFATDIRAVLMGDEAGEGEAGDFRMEASADAQGLCTVTLYRAQTK